VLEHDIELLERQFAFLMRQEGGDFVRQLSLFLQTMATEPRLGAHLEDIRIETGDFRLSEGYLQFRDFSG
jgi:hypothetical protein